MTAPQSRPRVVTAAFWCWVVASFLLILGGLIAASLNLPVAFRGAGIILALAGGALAFLTGRTRSGDTRFRRAAIALALTLILLVALAALFRLVNGITLLAMIPLIAGTVLITRPSAASTSEQEPQ
jgi:peptidoglycan/LPS O-acetylase OafA/YrhL